MYVSNNTVILLLIYVSSRKDVLCYHEPHLTKKYRTNLNAKIQILLNHTPPKFVIHVALSQPVRKSYCI